MIKENAEKILESLPHGVDLVAAAKFKTVPEIQQAIDGGIKFIGENYLQEAEEVHNAIGNKVEWHFIGHLQRNKARKAVKIFDMIETLDSERLAKTLDKECKKVDKVMPVLIEINSGREPQKSGILPEGLQDFLAKAEKYQNLKIMGLMTMGPFSGTIEEFRPYFKVTKQCFEDAKKLDISNLECKYLSMGMTASYRVALEEGANIVRIGTAIFGPR